MIFKSRKSLLFGLVLGPTVLLMIFTAVITFINTPIKWLGLLPVSVGILLPIWFWFNTYYQIENTQLKYKSAFIKGLVNIVEIREVIVGKSSFVRIKPALATKGLIIKYNRWDEIYISPEKETLFLEELLKINPEIKINKA